MGIVNNDSVFPFNKPNQAEVRKARDRQKESYRPFYQKRKNNRKNTNGRFTQYITEQIPNTFPPEFRTKCIKHESK